MKTQRELNLHYWGPIHEMVEAYNKEHSADVKPWECVRYDGALWSEMAILSAPQFDQSSARYQFAVAILFDEQAGIHKPVFHGDTIYSKLCSDEYSVCDGITMDWEYWTWNKPQPNRTFEINGVELPCPFKNHEEEKWILTVSGGVVGNRNRDFKFKSKTERDCVADRIIKILDEARDKP